MREKIFIMSAILKCCIICCTIQAQATQTTAVGDSLYRENITKTKLYGVYIPRDIPDAMLRLDALTEEKDRIKLRTISEDTMARKLFFGLGRWMTYNWNLDEGSRLSHLLRLKGLTHTEDMVYTLLVLYHRHIMEKDLNADLLIAEVVERRKKKIEEARSKQVVIDSFRVKVPKEN